MKRALIAVGLLLALSAVALADVEVGDRWVYGGQTPYHYLNGGEFQFTLTKNLNYPPYAPPANQGFVAGTQSTIYSFCAEIDQYIASPMYVTHLADAWDSDHSHHLTDFAEWVFWGYSTKDEGGNIVADRAGSGNPITKPTLPVLSGSPPSGVAVGATIQWTIWHEMQYAVSATPPNQALYNAWLAQYAVDNAANGAWDHYKDTHVDDPVMVAWLSSNYQDVLDGKWGGAQDQVVFIPARALSLIPEPASLAIWAVAGGLGAAGLALKRRRQNSRTRWPEENRQAIMSIIERGR
jgi:hypothetical protein